MAAVWRVVAWLRGRRGAILALAILWVVVTAAGAGRAADDSTWLGIPSLDWLTYVLVGCAVIGGITIVVAMFMAPKEGGPRPEKRKPMWPLLLVILVFLVLSQREPGPRAGDAEFVPPTTTEPGSGDGIGQAGGSLDPTEIGVVAIILMAAVIVLALSRRRGEAAIEADDDESIERSISPAVGRAADHLLLGSDPRSAVLLAYDGLETSLTGIDRGREVSETPREHLTRVLVDLPIDTTPLLQLAELYQVARFSTHAITDAEQQRAAAALQRARAELAALV